MWGCASAKTDQHPSVRVRRDRTGSCCRSRFQGPWSRGFACVIRWSCREFHRTTTHQPSWLANEAPTYPETSAVACRDPRSRAQMKRARGQGNRPPDQAGVRTANFENGVGFDFRSTSFPANPVSPSRQGRRSLRGPGSPSSGSAERQDNRCWGREGRKPDGGRFRTRLVSSLRRSRCCQAWANRRVPIDEDSPGGSSGPRQSRSYRRRGADEPSAWADV